jgi:hypothetical protein
VVIAHHILAWVETAKEHLWRILIDWSGELGRPAVHNALRHLLPLQMEARSALFGKKSPYGLDVRLALDAAKLVGVSHAIAALIRGAVLGVNPDRWLAIHDFKAFTKWLQRDECIAPAWLKQLLEQQAAAVGKGTLGFLPEMLPAELDQRLGGSEAAQFIAAPDWHGAQCETTPFARQSDHPLVSELTRRYGSGLLPRNLARLVELASIPQRICDLLQALNRLKGERDRSALPDGIGIGQVEAARGRLVHRLELEGERVARYAILAPTEWNFHPQGVVARGLATLEGDAEQIERQARGLIGAVDPCVGYRLTVQALPHA